MKKAALFCLASALMLILISGAFAQQGPCVPDIAKFCKGIQPGEGKVAQCLKANEGALSVGCKKHLIEAKEMVREVDQACEDDIHSYCSGMQPGGGRVLECLKAHKSQLHFKCKRTLAEAKKEMK